MPFDEAGVLEFLQPFHHHASGSRDSTRHLVEPGRPFRQDKQDPCCPPLEEHVEEGWAIAARGSNDDDSNDL